MKFKKKPVVVDAVQFTGTNFAAIVPFINQGDWKADWKWEGPLKIHTIEGDFTVSPGDWIIRGIKGECYPCKPDIFEATYEAVTA